MRELKTDPEIAKHLRLLTESEYSNLEEQCVNDGRIIDPIVVWKGKGVIIDGHNRYQIAKKHGLEFQVDEEEFDDIEEVREWMSRRQVGRRNLDRAESAILIRDYLEKNPQANTAEIAATLDVSPRQIQRVKKAVKAQEQFFPPDIVARIESGNLVASTNAKSKVDSLTPQDRDKVWDKLREDPKLTLDKAMPKKRTVVKLTPEELETLKVLSPSVQHRLSVGFQNADSASIRRFAKLTPPKQQAVDCILAEFKEFSLKQAIEEVQLHEKTKKSTKKNFFDTAKAAKQIDEAYGKLMRAIDDFAFGVNKTGTDDHKQAVELLKQSKTKWGQMT